MHNEQNYDDKAMDNGIDNGVDIGDDIGDDNNDDYADVNNDIAIIGMAGRFPKAENVEQFWTNLVSSTDCLTRFSREELERMGVSQAALDDPHFVPAAGFIPDQDKFDAHFFEMNPREAANLDPQHRFALEVAWQTLEHAGYTPESVNGSVGVFAGVNMSTYFIFNLLKGDEATAVGDALDTQISVDKDMFASRISYKLNLNGPSIALGTACSTSLVCIHLACQSLLNGESKMALAGGSHLATPNCTGHIYHQGGYSSPDGYCRPFDAKGQGTVGGAGTCFVLLKRMEDALADNDTIYAVIKGSAVNNDGSEKIGYTAPSIVGQTNIIAEAQAVAGVEPDTIRFIEAHGTATELGDPIEFTALTRAFRLQTDKKHFCGIGSVKSNIGHLGMAAGAASVVKAALALKYKVIPESLHFENPNPKLDIENSPFYVIDKLERIEPGEYPARAGVSSLGIGGTNAHVVLEEAPDTTSSASRDYQLLFLSAKTPTALDSMTENLATWMRNHGNEKLADAAYTLQLGRKAFAFRRAFVLQDGKLPQLAEQVAASKGFTARASDKRRKLVFMFPGGGTQHVDMARGLYEKEALFRTNLDACAALFRRQMGLDLIALIYPDATRAEEHAAILQKPKNFFAALFAIEYSLAQLWMSWGVKPDALIGHSLGEYTAACLAGVFSLEDAVSLICCRGALFEKIEKGAMLSVSLPASELQQLLIDGVSIATINDPGRCVVAGRLEPMAQFQAMLESREIEFKRLLIDTAGHSPMVEPILQEFEQFLSKIKFKQPSIPFISNISGDWADPAEIATAAYWKNHLRKTVRFSDGIATLLKDENSVFIEMGPGNALCSFVRSQLPENSSAVLLNSMRHLKEDKNDQCHLLETLGKLWMSGVTPDWQAFHTGEKRKRIALPGYAFERKRYWVENRKAVAQHGAKLPVAEWFWQTAWRLQEITPISQLNAAMNVPHTVLAFTDTHGITDAALASLQQQGVRVLTVRQGAGFAQDGEHGYVLDAIKASDYTALLQDLQSRQIEVETVLHAWSLDLAAATMGATSASAALATTANHADALLSFVYLAQAFNTCMPTRAVAILAITGNREAVLSGDMIDVQQAFIAGPARVIPYEFPHIRFSTLDIQVDIAKLEISQAAASHAVSSQANGSQVNGRQSGGSKTAQAIASELQHFCSNIDLEGKDSIAVRHGLRFVRDFVPLATTTPELEKLPLRKHGVYLITGGLGGVGLAHAQALAVCQARLILLQRAAFPAASTWQSILLDAGQDAVLKEQIRGIQALRAAGAEVLLLQADVTDTTQLNSALAQARAAFGPINGLVHCAGYGEFVAIKETSREIIEAVLAPKVDGTMKLLEALAGDALELVLLCSSMSVATTGYGLTGYISACAYLDALAQSHRASAAATGNEHVTRYLSINWDVWSTPLQTARASKDPTLLQRLQENKTAILPREGIEVIHRALTSSQPQAIISTVEFQHLLRKNRQLALALQDEAECENLDAGSDSASNLALYERPSLSSAYVAPSSAAEKQLAAIWQETLGIAKIGVHDNFFELGGESLLGVKIVVKAKKMGLLIDPKQMFATPTIAQIVESLDSAATITVAQGLVSGDAVCTPVQQQFLKADWAMPDRWNVGLLQDTDRVLEASRWQEIVAALISHHDVLRSHFSKPVDSATNWRQVYASLEAGRHSDYIDLSSLAVGTTETLNTSIQAHCLRLQEQMHIEAGPVCMLAYFRLPQGGAKIALIAHHLVMDAISLSFVLEDLSTLLDADCPATELAALLPSKTSSYQDFAEKLAGLSNTDALAADIAYWQQAAKQVSNQVAADPAAWSMAFPSESPHGTNLQRDARTLETTLSNDLTQSLQNAARISGVKLNEFLLAALAKVLTDSQGSKHCALDVVGHGRPDLDGLDLARTVGWFGSGAPLLLQLQAQALPQQMHAIKAQIDAVPRQGLSLAWLNCLHKDEAVRASLAGLPVAQVSLNYLGQLDHNNTIKANNNSNGNANQANGLDGLRGADNHRLYQHELVALITQGQLALHWTYSDKRHTEATIQALLDALIAYLEQLAATDWQTVQSSSQFKLSQATLEKYGIAADAVEDMYPLTPLQSEIYSRYQAGQRSNISQALSVMEGPLDRDLLQNVWQVLIARHKVLRTRFIEDESGEVLQVVCRQAAFQVTALDYSHLDEAGQRAALHTLMADDRCHPYTLSQAPALRLYHVTLAPQLGRFAIVLSHHQIILDGWTSSLLSQDLLACLQAMVSATALPPLVEASDFGRYANWLAKRSSREDEAYWRSTFKNYQPSDPLQFLLQPQTISATTEDVGTVGAEDRYGSHQLMVDADLLARVQESARASQTTGNALFQAAWALSLAQLRGDLDIVYGVTVSGRSADYEGIAEVIGQCTNTLPVRIRIDTTANVAQLLKVIHAANAQAQAHANLPLTRIAALLEGEAPEQLYASNFIFENIPRAASGEGALPIRSIMADWVDGWHFPLRVFVVPEEQTWVRFAYDTQRFNHADITQLAARYQGNLIALVAQLEQALATLMGEA